MSISYSEMMAWLGVFWFPFVRCAGFFIMTPIFGDGAVPSRVKILLAGVICLLIMPLIDSSKLPLFNPFTFNTVLLTFYQLLFGGLLGFVVLLFFTIYTMAGQAISMQMGLAMAIMNDPSNGISVAIIGRFYLIFCTLLFLSFDAHLVILSIFVDSFNHWHLGSTLPLTGMTEIVQMLGWVIGSALMIAAPAIAIMLLSNVAFGFMSKAAPSLNIFALGFPMTIILGMFALAVSMTGVGDNYFDLVLSMQDRMNSILRLD